MSDVSVVRIPQKVLLALETCLLDLDMLESNIRRAMSDNYPLRMNYQAKTTLAVTSKVRHMFASDEELDVALRDLSREQVNREYARLLRKSAVPLLSYVSTMLTTLWETIVEEVHRGRDAHGAVVSYMPDKQIARLEDTLATMRVIQSQLERD